MNWRSQAACRTLGPSLFFGPNDESSGDRIKREATAKLVCYKCEVVGDCLVEGQAEEGIWGGMTDSDRRRATQRSRYSPVRPFPVHITPSIQNNDAPWTALESSGRMMLFRRDSMDSWHGSEFLVVRDGIVIEQTDDLNKAYMTYARLVE